MTGSLAGAVAVAMAIAGRPPPAFTGPLTGRLFATPAEAVSAALASQPVVVAFGEFHQTTRTAAVPSALHRFRTEILPALSGAAAGRGGATGSAGGTARLTHLVLETWISTGRCGPAERAITEDIPRTTQRPAATEGELETLIRAAAQSGVTPRILSIGCAEYQAMQAADGTVDYQQTLRLTRDALAKAALDAVADRRRRLSAPAAQTSTGNGRDTGGGADASAVAAPAQCRPVGVYGGALHNDVYPQPALVSYTFAPEVMAATLGRYLELDLVVPEYVADNPAVRAEPWWIAYRRLQRVRGGLDAERSPTPTPSVLVQRGPTSFVLIFPAGRSPAKRSAIR